MSQATFMERDTNHGARPGEFGEGTLAKMIEEQTAKLPSDAFLWAAGASIVGSLALQIMGEKKRSQFLLVNGLPRF